MEMKLMLFASLVTLSQFIHGNSGPDGFCPGTGSNPMAGLPFNLGDGEVVAADYADDREALAVWNFVTNALHHGTGPYNSWADDQITHYKDDGDYLAPGFDCKVHYGYRRLDTNGQQSEWDERYQPDSTRAQLGGWDENSNLHVSREGHREFIVYSVRLDSTPSLNKSIFEYDGLYHTSMISQFKSLGGANPPMISVYEGADGIQLATVVDGKKEYIPVVAPRGVWLRIGIDVMWSQNNGAYRWWVDVTDDGVRNFKPIGDRRVTPTLGPDAEGATMNIGPYHKLNHVQKHGRDYGNIEFFEHYHGDAW